jgi:UDP-N-acetylmuramoylalanine--D-glutamate ligase
VRALSACARLAHCHHDTREHPPGAKLQAFDPSIPVRLGGLDTKLLDDALCVVVSPGISLAEPFCVEARRRGLEIVGDVELFARAVDAPVVGITGTNGKSTVTTLIGRMASRAGLNVRVGGNLGEPALDLLSASESDARKTELYVLELSSYQLESTESLDLKAGIVLNVTPDHMDRYATIEDYAAAKARIFTRCDTAVINLDDPLVVAMPGPGQRTLGFSLRASIGAEYAVVTGLDSKWWLTRRGELLLPVSEMKISGLHNAANALAALALGEALGLPLQMMLQELREFPGLPHRSQWVADVNGVTYVNDSKGTNVGATLAAVAGMAPLVMIAGGDGKNQDFAPLADAFRGKVRHAVLIGRDAQAIADALEGAAVERHDARGSGTRGSSWAKAGDTVLSPACASLDMFRDYTHRGAVFTQAVKDLAA